MAFRPLFNWNIKKTVVDGGSSEQASSGRTAQSNHGVGEIVDNHLEDGHVESVQ
jgi:hypothetical protein